MGVALPTHAENWHRSQGVCWFLKPLGTCCISMYMVWNRCWARCLCMAQNIQAHGPENLVKACPVITKSGLHGGFYGVCVISGILCVPLDQIKPPTSMQGTPHWGHLRSLVRGYINNTVGSHLGPQVPSSNLSTYGQSDHA